MDLSYSARNKKEPNKGGKIPMLGFLLFPFKFRD